MHPRLIQYCSSFRRRSWKLRPFLADVVVCDFLFFMKHFKCVSCGLYFPGGSNNPRDASFLSIWCSIRSSALSVTSRATRGSIVEPSILSRRSPIIILAALSAPACSVRIPGSRQDASKIDECIDEKNAVSPAPITCPHFAHRSNGGSQPPSLTDHKAKYARGTSAFPDRFTSCEASRSNLKLASEGSRSGSRACVISLNSARATLDG